MKKWNEYTRQEKIMIIALVVLLIAVIFSWGRVSTGIDKGIHLFYNVPADTINVQP